MKANRYGAQPSHSPGLVFPGLEIRLHRGRIHQFYD